MALAACVLVSWLWMVINTGWCSEYGTQSVSRRLLNANMQGSELVLKRLENLEKQMNEYSVKEEDSKKRTLQQEKRIFEQEKRISELEERISVKEKRIIEHNSKLNRLEQLEKRLLEQDGHMHGQETRISAQEKRIIEQYNKLKRLEEFEERILEQDDRLQQQAQQIKRLRAALLRCKIQIKEEEKITGGLVDNAVEHKRADDTSGWEPVVSQLSSRMTEVTAEIQALKNVNAQQDQKIQDVCSHGIGSTYVRWGHGSCPNSTETVYSGTIGGGYFGHSGAPSEYLCLPPDPVFDAHSTSGAESSLYGAEYEVSPQNDLTPRCAVCRTHRSATIMIPAENSCRQGWTVEYIGHVMAGAESHSMASEYICVDSAMDYVPGTNGNENGKLLYYTQTACGSLPCPPYENAKIVLCVVCSK